MVGVWSGLEERRSRLVGEGNWAEEKGAFQERGKTQAKEEEEGTAARALWAAGEPWGLELQALSQAVKACFS